jgi:hypothetical protein
MIRPQCLFTALWSALPEVTQLVNYGGAMLLGGIIRLVLTLPVVIVLVVLLWKLGKLADAYVEKLKAK